MITFFTNSKLRNILKHIASKSAETLQYYMIPLKSKMIIICKCHSW